MTKLSERISPPRIFNNQVFFTETTTFSPPIDIWALVICVGGGGGGSAAVSDNDLVMAGGGAAGTIAFKLAYLQSSVTYTCTIGAGGARVFPTYQGNLNGGNGGDTWFEGTGFARMTADGGQGGRTLRTAITTTAVQRTSIQTAGSATGADWFFPGGLGGRCEHNPSVATDDAIYLAGGGGAVNVFGNPAVQVRGGNPESTHDTVKLATGGGGVGGHGGDITTSALGAAAASGGGGGFGAAFDVVSANVLSTGGGGGQGYEGGSGKIYQPVGRGQVGSGSWDFNQLPEYKPSPGGGGGGITNTIDVQPTYDVAGAFGGGGAAIAAGTNPAFGGFGKWGGGGGGAVGSASSQNGTASGEGGGGIIIIDWVTA